MSRRYFTIEDDAAIVALHGCGHTDYEIAHAIGRSASAVESRRLYLAMPTDERAARRARRTANERQRLAAKRRPLPRTVQSRHAPACFGRCLAFRPTYDERRGRLAHVAD